MFERYRELQRKRASVGRDESGFTLIELLIVIVVMGILVAVVIFALGGVTSKSQAAACNTDAKTVVTAVTAFEAAGNSTALLTSTTAPSLLTGTADSGPFIGSWPSNSSYSIGIDQATGDAAGEVDVKIGSGSWVDYSPTACTDA